MFAQVHADDDTSCTIETVIVFIKRLVKDLSQILRILTVFSFAVLCILFFTWEDTDLLNSGEYFSFEIRSPTETL